MRKAPPPTPELCGSTSPSIACTATAASTALPPLRRISAPASAAAGLAAATMEGTLAARAAARAGLSAPAPGANVQTRQMRASNRRGRNVSWGIRGGSSRRGSARAKRVGGLARIEYARFHGSDFGGGGADPELPLQLLQRVRLSEGKHFHAAIGQ